MKNRAVEIAGFLTQHGWDDAEHMPMDADLSPRRYARLMKPDGPRAILMDADDDQKTHDFVAIAKLLRACGISAPEIYAANPPAGLVLMEDFGSVNIGRMIDSGTPPAILYRRAVEVLAHLHKNFDKSMARDIDVPVFGGALFAAQAELYIDAYIPYIKGREATREEGESFRTAWKDVLKGIEGLPQTLMLRDFMPDNLMDLPKREEWQSVGVLDFQDGGHGPIAYDLASLCECVRRDCSDILLDEMIVYYHELAQPGISAEDLRSACYILSAQRHTRILGLIVQYARKTGRNEKLDWLPRIKNYLEFVLKDKSLRPVRLWMEQFA